jgi:hypothetical protein
LGRTPPYGCARDDLDDRFATNREALINRSSTEVDNRSIVTAQQ